MTDKSFPDQPRTLKEWQDTAIYALLQANGEWRLRDKAEEKIASLELGEKQAVGLLDAMHKEVKRLEGRLDEKEHEIRQVMEHRDELEAENAKLNAEWDAKYRELDDVLAENAALKQKLEKYKDDWHEVNAKLAKAKKEIVRLTNASYDEGRSPAPNDETEFRG